MGLVSAHDSVVTARKSSSFECTMCHGEITGGSQYVQHKYVQTGPRGGRYSETYRYHVDCHDPPTPARSLRNASGSSTAPLLADPKVAIVAAAVVAVILAGVAVYVWWTKKPKAVTA